MLILRIFSIKICTQFFSIRGRSKLHHGYGKHRMNGRFRGGGSTPERDIVNFRSRKVNYRENISEPVNPHIQTLPSNYWLLHEHREISRFYPQIRSPNFVESI